MKNWNEVLGFLGFFIKETCLEVEREAGSGLGSELVL